MAEVSREAVEVVVKEAVHRLVRRLAVEVEAEVPIQSELVLSVLIWRNLLTTMLTVDPGPKTFT